MKDYYKILGVSQSASPEEIRRAYHKLAHRHHPHKGGDEKKFKEINEAYQTLSDKEKRTQYDTFGQVFEGGQTGPSFDFRQWQKFGDGFDFESKDLGGMDLGEMIEELFGMSSATKKRDLKRGKDIRVNLEIPLEDTLASQEKEIILEKQVSCPRCNGKGAEPGTSINECFSCRGTGEVQQIKRTFFGTFTKYIICPECGGEGFKPETLCNVCKGEGRIEEKEKIKVIIPAGVDSNQVLRIKGKGDAGRRGGKPGDLYLGILIKEHPLFKRKGDDLYLRVPISFPQAALGDEIEISILGGKKILLKIPKGTESGRTLRISGKGTSHFSGFGRGNLYVELLIKTPQKLTKKQKEILEKLKEEEI